MFSSTSVEAKSPWIPNPALLTKASYRYALDSTSRTSRSMPSMQPRSAATTSVCTRYLAEHSAATSVSVRSFLPVRNTLNPPAANSRARPLPMPEEAPVIMAHLSAIQTLIAGAKHVLWIERLLQIALPLQGGFGHDARQEHPAQLAYAVMVRQRTSAFQNLVARNILQIQIDLLRIRNPFVIEREIEIDAHARSIQLGDARRHDRFARQSPALIFFRHAAFDVLAER